MKDVIAGFLIGVFAVMVPNKKAVVTFGLAVGLALAFWVASVPDPDTGKHYYLAIMLPGGLVGLLVGYFTAKYGTRSLTRAEGPVAGTGHQPRRINSCPMCTPSRPAITPSLPT